MTTSSRRVASHPRQNLHDDIDYDKDYDNDDGDDDDDEDVIGNFQEARRFFRQIISALDFCHRFSTSVFNFIISVFCQLYDQSDQNCDTNLTPTLTMFPIVTMTKNSKL